MINSKEKKYRCVHIMIINSNVHNESIIKVISEIPEEKNEHIYIIKDEKSYEYLKKYENVIFEKNIINNVKILIEYSKKCDYIFFHSLNVSIKYLLAIPKDVANRIIWVTWGHDIYRKEAITLKEKVKKIFYYLLKFPLKKYKVNQFFAIGVGFKYDIIQIKKEFGARIKILPLPYGYNKGKKEFIDTILNKSFEKKEKEYKIMIGHCAYSFLNHIEIMKKILKYRNENIKISLILSYGDQTYANEVEKFAKENFSTNKLEIIKEKMSEKEYIEYLNSVDICILDFKHQAALGNLWRILYLKKKVFLSSNGILKLATNFEGAKTYDVEMLDKISYEELIKPVDDKESCRKCAEFYINEENYLNMWKNSLNELKNNEKVMLK